MVRRFWDTRARSGSQAVPTKQTQFFFFFFFLMGVIRRFICMERDGLLLLQTADIPECIE
jgi:hypothetical protein